MSGRHTRIIVTLGPSTRTEQALRNIKARGVDFVRVNMSHSSISDLEYFVDLSRKVGIPFIIDTEGSQMRTGDLTETAVHFSENEPVRLQAEPVPGDRSRLSLRPGFVIQQLDVGDLIHIDFDTLILRVTDTSTASQGYITAKTITGGQIGRNKAVAVDPVLRKRFEIPPLSEKDYQSIELGLQAGIEHIAVSFVRSGESIDEVRRATRNRMKVISKIECVDALENIDEIIRKSDFLLIDRGDLSKEIPLEKIPFTQKVILHKAARNHTGVFVATNLLETMIEKRKPTRAEVHDVLNTIVDGAFGLTLSAETAIGRYPIECVNMLNKLIQHAESVIHDSDPRNLVKGLIGSLENSNYLLEDTASSLVSPHGGRLVNRVLVEAPDPDTLAGMPGVRLDRNRQMDVEQIAVGAYSPLQGFMGEADFNAVLTDMRLASGVAWPLPIVLDVPEDVAAGLSIGDRVGLTDDTDEVMAVLHLDEMYRFDVDRTVDQLFGTDSADHPGVQAVRAMHPVLLGGTIDLVRGRDSETRAYELTPKQLRRLFDERGWATVLGFHTRNVLHRGHEFMQLAAMEKENCDGLLVHPVVGKKKPGDFRPEYIIRSYEKMVADFYPREKVVFAVFPTFSRYAGPREAVFTALCRKNYGCSHFIVGRDHTGVGDFYPPYASQEIFERFPDLGMTIVPYREVVYSRSVGEYVERGDGSSPEGADHLGLISGSQAREMLLRGERPPEWFMRPEIADLVLDALRDGEQVFEGQSARI